MRLFRNITEDVKIYLKLKSGTRGTAARVTDRIQLFKNLSPFKNFQHSPCNYLAVKSSKQRLNKGDSVARIRKNRRHSQVLHFLTNLPLFRIKICGIERFSNEVCFAFYPWPRSMQSSLPV